MKRICKNCMINQDGLPDRSYNIKGEIKLYWYSYEKDYYTFNLNTNKTCWAIDYIHLSIHEGYEI